MEPEEFVVFLGLPAAHIEIMIARPSKKEENHVSLCTWFFIRFWRRFGVDLGREKSGSLSKQIIEVKKVSLKEVFQSCK